jgi:hypothetical protein
VFSEVCLGDPRPNRRSSTFISGSHAVVRDSVGIGGWTRRSALVVRRSHRKDGGRSPPYRCRPVSVSSVLQSLPILSSWQASSTKRPQVLKAGRILSHAVTLGREGTNVRTKENKNIAGIGIPRSRLPAFPPSSVPPTAPLRLCVSPSWVAAGGRDGVSGPRWWRYRHDFQFLWNTRTSRGVFHTTRNSAAGPC